MASVRRHCGTAEIWGDMGRYGEARPSPHPLCRAASGCSPRSTRGRWCVGRWCAQGVSAAPGVVILLVVSVLTLLGCYFAGAMQPARRACVSCSLFVLFCALACCLLALPFSSCLPPPASPSSVAATLLFLSCYPRQTDEWRDYAGPTDASPLLRSLFALLLFLTALAGPIAIAATHLAPPQRIDWPPPLSACKEEAGGAA
uniref:Uncharacterized protein n=1 Tax=Emiliania huxleyi TaxID=2903 RepID=A0A7S3TBX6_EMIHU